MAKLISSGGDGPALVVELTDGLTIGREDDLGLTLDDVKVSRRHAKVIAVEGGFAIQDLGSTNGTLVNGSRVQQVILEHGDKVRIGRTRLTYDAPAITPVDPAKPAGKLAPGQKAPQKIIDFNKPSEGKARPRKFSQRGGGRRRR